MNDLDSRLKSVRTLATHNDTFHADEVLAVATLQYINPELKVIRTRDQDMVVNADMRVDIGKKYSVDTLDFDHHQKEGAGKRNNDIPYASAGLIWKHYGHIILPDHDSFTYIDHKIFQPIDAEDNGKKIYDTTVKKPFTLYDIINSYNSLWQDKALSQDEAFAEAVDLARKILRNEILKAKHIPEYNKTVRSEIEQQKNNPYLVLKADIPWQPTVIRNTDMKYVIYPDGDGNWRTRAVPTKIEGFTPKVPFPESWCGLSKEELQKISGIYDAEFCHITGFLTVAKSKEGAIALAEKSLENYYKSG